MGAINTDEYPELIKRYANYKRIVKACAEKTVAEYLLDLRTFCRFLAARREGIDMNSDEFEKTDISSFTSDFFGEVTESDIFEFLIYAKNDRGNNERAIARKLSAIKQFYKYCVAHERLYEINPAANIETPKLKVGLPKYLEVDECMKLLESVLENEESNTRERDYCILTIFLNCGIRLSELAGISLNDIDSDLRSMRVIGKGSKERIVYLNDACRTAINRYLPVRMKTPVKHKDEAALFVSREGNRISVKTVQWMVKKYLSIAGLEYKNYSTHKLRHTAATLMYQSGEVDIRVLKDILGHEQLNTTQIYTHVANASMEEAMTKNPLSELTPAEVTHDYSDKQNKDSQEESE